MSAMPAENPPFGILESRKMSELNQHLAQLEFAAEAEKHVAQFLREFAFEMGDAIIGCSPSPPSDDGVADFPAIFGAAHWVEPRLDAAGVYIGNLSVAHARCPRVGDTYLPLVAINHFFDVAKPSVLSEFKLPPRTPGSSVAGANTMLLVCEWRELPAFPIWLASVLATRRHGEAPPPPPIYFDERFLIGPPSATKFAVTVAAAKFFDDDDFDDDGPFWSGFLPPQISQGRRA